MVQVAPRSGHQAEAVFTLMTCGPFSTLASKFHIEPNGGIFDVSQENDFASPNMETP